MFPTRLAKSKLEFFADDGFARYVLAGWAPRKPFITKSDVISCFGSCFSWHMSEYLTRKGYQLSTNQEKWRGIPQSASNAEGVPFIIQTPAAIANTFAFREQFAWAFGEIDSPRLFKHYERDLIPTDEIQEETKAVFRSTSVFILTLGLSEVWRDRETGQVAWSIGKEDDDIEKYEFVISSVDDNLANLRTILGIIRRHMDDVPIIFALSPVPLMATFRTTSCWTANQVSKATLRVAIDLLMREFAHDGRLFYWPSYDYVVSRGPAAFQRDLRHVNPRTVRIVCRYFGRAYLK